ncbi:MAG TPA: YggS family pyridoxal phosphate-dependent enzyme [Baekduia sp.]|uniref:YggS family pyridoxal phosphate-dependent enzyme n=1 Tax=Baekduia sp. TaxID=2600305 RepID=UPI002CE579D9|nr:YggS family pyridoxal phosphate-dependent enzyme [Baekduia sp.]HMJ35506.1 YggS family pyridoxal phosphate-dependent enzyme [Baekduia sp.]
MAQLIEGLTVERVRANLEQVRGEIADAAARAGRDPAEVALLAAVKYVAADELPVLAEAGIELVGENRAQELQRKVAAPGGDRFTWDFIGHLQSRKVKQILPHVRLIHSVGSESVVRELGRYAGGRDAGGRDTGTRVLVEVNIAGEEGKSGIAPEALDDFIAQCREVGGVEVAGLMTMPPLAQRAEDSRRWFAALAELAAARGLPERSMGTTQDFAVAVEEGATIVRVGTKLYR